MVMRLPFSLNGSPRDVSKGSPNARDRTIKKQIARKSGLTVLFDIFVPSGANARYITIYDAVRPNKRFERNVLQEYYYGKFAAYFMQLFSRYSESSKSRALFLRDNHES